MFGSNGNTEEEERYVPVIILHWITCSGVLFTRLGRHSGGG